MVNTNLTMKKLANVNKILTRFQSNYKIYKQKMLKI